MSRQIITTDAAPKSAAYSQAVVAAGLVFVSGQAALDPETGEWFPTDPAARQGAALPVDVPGLLVSVAAIAEA